MDRDDLHGGIDLEAPRGDLIRGVHTYQIQNCNARKIYVHARIGQCNTARACRRSGMGPSSVRLLRVNPNCDLHARKWNLNLDHQHSLHQSKHKSISAVEQVIKKRKKPESKKTRPVAISPALQTWPLLACSRSAHEYEAHAGRAGTTATHTPPSPSSSSQGGPRTFLLGAMVLGRGS